MGFRLTPDDWRLDINWLLPSLFVVCGAGAFHFAYDLLNNPVSRNRFSNQNRGLSATQLDAALVGQAWRYAGFGILFLALAVGAWFLLCRGKEDLS